MRSIAWFGWIGLWLGFATVGIAQAPAPTLPNAGAAPSGSAAPSAPAAGPAASPSATAPAGPAVTTQQAPAPTVQSLQEFLLAARDALGRNCAAREIATQGELRYAACGDAGVWIVRVRGDVYELISVQDMRGEVEGFFAREGELWARVTTRSAIPIARAGALATGVQPTPLATASSAPATSGAAPSGAHDHEMAPRTHGEVIESGPGYAIVDFGSSDLLADRAHIAFYRVSRHPLEEYVSGTQREQLAVGVVDSVAATRARVQLGINESVPKGALAEATSDELSASAIAPPRVAGLWEFAFLARPFLVLGDLGAGLVIDASLGYRTGHFHLDGVLLPLAIASAGDGGTLPALAFVSGSYDSHLFEVGLGLGGQTVNDTDSGLQPGTGASLVQRARLGARDGLNLEVFTDVVLFHSEFAFSGVRVTGQIPLGRGGWLLLSGGGGTVGLDFGEIGLRALLEGNGDRDSLFVTVTVGGANAFESDSCNESFCEVQLDYGGPTIGAGLEWRL